MAKMVCSNENLREENYLSYLYFKFYFVAGHVDSLSKYGVHLERQQALETRNEWTAGKCRGQKTRSEWTQAVVQDGRRGVNGLQAGVQDRRGGVNGLQACEQDRRRGVNGL
jgi:hypothetical protein